MSRLSPENFYRRNLPHLQPPGAAFFVTFRLAGSIPKAVLDELREETEIVQAKLDLMPDSPEHTERLYREQRLLFKKWDDALDAGTGPDWLRTPSIAQMVAENMRRYDAKRYDLLAYCIMSNHVHVVLRPLPDTGKESKGKREGKAEKKSQSERRSGEEKKSEEEYYSLSRIMHTMKGYTSGRANRLLGRTGAFWQHESYDHYVRDLPEMERIIAYTIGNSVKAKMVEKWEEWPWTYVAPLAFPR
jgi:putative transposase